MRQIVIGDPKPGIYTVDELMGAGCYGYYEVAPCQCSFCKELRREAYYKPLEDWREMNKQIIDQKETERRAEVRDKHTCSPITYRIVLDMEVDQPTKMKLCAFIGGVISSAECSNMLGYAMRIRRSETSEYRTNPRQIYYDLIVDVDVSITINIALTELMGSIYQLAHDSGLVGNGLNIINMDVCA